MVFILISGYNDKIILTKIKTIGNHMQQKSREILSIFRVKTGVIAGLGACFILLSFLFNKFYF